MAQVKRPTGGTEGPVIRKILDDLFDAYTILGRGAYVSLYDVKGQMTRYSHAAVELFGLPGEYIPAGADNWSDFVHPEDRPRYEKVMGELISGDAKHYDISYRVRLKDGSYVLLRLLGSILRDEAGKPELIGGIFINEGLMENTDSVTALRNQYGFFQDLAAATELKKNCVLLLIDLAHMGEINETHGYSYGNRVLQQVGWLLQESLGARGTVYRMDGYKFAFITEGMEAGEVAEQYERLRRRMLGGIPVDEMRQSIVEAGGLLSFSGNAVDERTLYSALSYVCSESMIHKNGRLVNFDGNMNRDAIESLEMINEIRSAILVDCAGFFLEYQPIVYADTERPIAIEARLRWRHEKFGLVHPGEYVPILERDFVFAELGYWIMRQAMEDAKKLLDRGYEIYLVLSVAGVQIEDEFFINDLTKVSEQTGFPLKNLCIELTQGCRLLEMGFLKKLASSLRIAGVRFTIGDFGSGLDSIEFLRELAPDYVKFDRKYIDGLKDREENRELVKKLAELVSAFGAGICVKGVRTRSIRNILKEFEVLCMQGDFYSRPLPIDDLMENYLGSQPD